jgi:nucleoside-diphosphate-sugar epimerase
MNGIYTDRCHQPTLAHQIQRIYERQMTSHLFPGSTAHGQPLMHLDDLVDALARVVAHRADLPPETVLLLGEPETMSYDALQHTLARLIHDEDWETRQIPKAVAKTGAWMEGLLPGEEPFIKPWMVDIADDHWELDIARARTLLGWEPKHRLRDTLPKIVAFLKADPLGFYRENKLTPPKRLEEESRERSHAEGDEDGEEDRADSPEPSHAA